MAAERSFAPHWRKRVAVAVLVVGMILILDGLLRQRPADHLVVLRYGSHRAGLLAADLTYRRAGEVIARVTFSYRRQPALREQRHTLRLTPGPYELDLALRYGPAPERVVRLRRLLAVSREVPSRVALE